MRENKIAPVSSPRITVIDALRGFALSGVILMHMLDHFGYTTGNMPSAAPDVWDTAIQWFTGKVIRGKFISIFSFLFGLSFYIQMDRASKKGIDFRGRFLWRMLLLFVIGLIGTSFTYLDILAIYAVFGVVLVFLFPLKNWVLTVMAGLLLSGAPYLFLSDFDKIRPDNAMTEQPAITVLPAITAFPAMPGQPAEHGTFVPATFFQSAKENLIVKNLIKLRFQFIYSSTGYLILALFIMGFIVGRLRFFEQVHIRKKRNLMLLFLFLIITVGLLMAIKLLPEVPADLLSIKAEGGELPFIALVNSTLNSLSTIALSATLAMGFISLYQVAGIRKYLELLTPYGRMGLTNYEMQNVIGAILFSAWGFGSVFGGKGAAWLFVLGLIIYSLQVAVSAHWIKHFLYGSLEWLWRSGTYLKWQPFKRKLKQDKIACEGGKVTN